ncbi:MAG: formate dehydrogenase accessory sulfurtransferase FdhD [Armatimonadota bacterium]
MLRVAEGRARAHSDDLVTEEPLEIRLLAGEQRQTVAVTLRTPGQDFELAAGFLYAEGVVRSRDEIRRIAYCTDPGEAQQYNIVNVELRGEGIPDLERLERHFYTTSACGVCGKAGLEQLELRGQHPLEDASRVRAEVLPRLPEKLRQAQGLFERTGGLHAAALFDLEGNLLAVREDVGRHNALDKLIGWALLEGHLPLRERLVLVSGRASYELCQKALAAGAPVLAAISAPSSLAVELARQFNLTLVGFLRESFNVYSAPERILLP